MLQGDEFVFLFKLREIKAGDEFNGFERGFKSPSEIVGQFAEFVPGEELVKSTDGGGDGMNFAAADKRDDAVTDFLEAESFFHDGAVITSHGNAIFIAQKIRRVEHVNV